ncbi:hypothetical protein HanRHA438_Chr16g0750181 [Helianthus annuus]|uniref:Uncharacterized protein n=1 Tax=Helianthus annuus TaxID=4232 RepID=A0A9K3DRK5_HELAN|nr:hypothetical protein HanXRQr2_Chr16g0738021 [Helianthus annuus]KAJ0437404.1 hypothetical protein HanHA300_Chr16g0601761 [Helianthus annuus]KAJ0441823.1 hypothetical protein HanIR_Chr16g0802191 [Helianthus annuus]KAJ0459723.1 hypothetical protein HanHA89_Chr16g0652291 [Helianthus annuus]KAJ0640196.1 hypothetical protein HanLR1_Chr16g0612561 [Helianthus annuus]
MLMNFRPPATQLADISVGNFRWLRERIEKRIENFSSGPEDDSETTMRSVTGGNQRKLHRVWTFFGSKEVVRWCCSFRCRKMDSYKKSLFSSSTHQTRIHLKVHVDKGIVPGVTMSLATGATYFQD